MRACMGHKWVGFDSVKWKEAAKLYRKMLGCWIRYFTSGAVIGSRMFVNEVFTSARERFSSRRKDGARAMKGDAQAARGQLWSMRDVKV